MIERFKGVLFDWDGTLFNSESSLFRIWKKAAESLGRTIEERQFRPLIGRVARDIAVVLFPEDPPETTDLLLNRRVRFYDEFYSQAKPYPDAEECLEGLSRRGFSMAVITSNSAARVQGLLQNLGWEKFFRGVVGEGMVAEPKPSPQIVIEAARILGPPPEECLVVGDAEWDIVAGNRAGAVTVLVCRDESKAKELLEFHPRYRVNDLRKILPILK
jgi:HAD superfamily hydrolase (TIGR01509 family)